MGRADEGRANRRYLQTNDLRGSYLGHLQVTQISGVQPTLRTTPPRRRSVDQTLARTLFPLNPLALLHSPRPPRSLTGDACCPG